MNSNELREKFLRFFEEKGHKRVPASSLVPADSSVLFTTAGMQQFKTYFLGEESPYGSKVVSSQICLRTSDINSVGDETHLTFFEMLGNFSFGAYFKKETIEYAFEFLTEECNLSKERLWFTYFKGDKNLLEDKESRNYVINLGIRESKIIGFDRKENFWGPTGNEGPCGPTGEIHYDLTGKPCSLGKKCLPNCPCGRFVELWNLVFNEYFSNSKKELSTLKQKGIDTGMGLERLTMVVQGKKNIFETDLFSPLVEKIGKRIIKKQKENPFFNEEKRIRIMADHIKAAVFVIAEEIFPGKEGRQYIPRLLIRRAVRCGRMLGFPHNFLVGLVDEVINIYGSCYPYLFRDKDIIYSTIQKEEKKFAKKLEEGLKIFEKMIDKKYNSLKWINNILIFKPLKKKFSGKDAFTLYATYGFPLELIEEEAMSAGLVVDIKGFFKELKKHQEISRAGAEKKFGGIGIDKIKNSAEREKAIKLHTATHLLHQSLRNIFGFEVKQSGSDINSERLRFDFSFSRKLTEEELKKIEELVNVKIREDLEIEKKEVKYEEAIKEGALAFFKEKYPDIVTVYSIGDFSKELCAGPHVQRTGELGQFKIIKEESVGAGLRRIKAKLI